jgi:hypothetical protein
MPRRLSLLLACLMLAALLAPAASGAASPAAAAARSCTPPKYPGSGYFTSVRARGVSCPDARRVVLAHYRCRTRTGRAGRCRRTVLRYRCSETRRSIATEIDGRVSCRRGSRSVIYTYQQDI